MLKMAFNNSSSIAFLMAVGDQYEHSDGYGSGYGDEDFQVEIDGVGRNLTGDENLEVVLMGAGANCVEGESTCQNWTLSIDSEWKNPCQVVIGPLGALWIDFALILAAFALILGILMKKAYVRLYLGLRRLYFGWRWRRSFGGHPPPTSGHRAPPGGHSASPGGHSASDVEISMEINGAH